jgi:hypothetical protein
MQIFSSIFGLMKYLMKFGARSMNFCIETDNRCISISCTKYEMLFVDCKYSDDAQLCGYNKYIYCISNLYSNTVHNNKNK